MTLTDPKRGTEDISIADLPVRKRGRKPIKSGFVRSLPLDTPAKEVVRLARKAGIKLTRKYVHQCRNRMRTLLSTVERSASAARSAAKKPIGPAEKRAREWKAEIEKKSKPAVEPVVAATAKVPAANLESVLLAIVTRIGITRARRLLEQHEQALNLLGPA